MNVTILGVSGSIGTQTIEVVRKLKRSGHNLKIDGIASYGRNIKYLKEIIAEFDIKHIALVKNSELLNSSGRRFYDMEKDFEMFLSGTSSTTYLNAISGNSGYMTTYRLLKTTTARVLLANKESLVFLSRFLSKEEIARIIPVDSEHISLMKLLKSLENLKLEEIVITASGGSTLRTPLESLENLSVDEILKHPKWSMGKKITINSATMINKAMELIEAHYLFDIPVTKLSAVIHPEALLHAFLRKGDGSLLASLSINDMRPVIESAMLWPRSGTSSQRIELGQLNFEAISRERYPAYFIYLEAFQHGYSTLIAATVLNELAVEAFIDGKINFGAISQIIASALERDYREITAPSELPSFESEIKKYFLRRFSVKNK